MRLTITLLIPLLLGACVATIRIPDPMEISKAAEAREASMSAVPGYDTVKTYVHAMETNDAVGAAKVFDVQGVVARATEGLALPPGFEAGLSAGISEGMRLGIEAIGAQVARGATLTIIHGKSGPDSSQFIVRLLPAEGGVNYLRIDLAKGPDGAFRIVDLLHFASSDSMVRMFRRSALAMVLEVQPQETVAASLGATDQLWMKHLMTVHSLMDAVRNEDLVAMKDALEALPVLLRQDSMITALRLQIARQQGTEQYLAAMNELTRLSPNDPTIQFLTLDASFLRKEYGAFREDVDRLDRALGGDPYLEVLRASSHLAERDATTAQQVLERALQREGNLSAAWEVLAIMSHARRLPAAETIRVLEGWVGATGISVAEICERKDWRSFCAFGEGNAWWKRHVTAGTKH